MPNGIVSCSASPAESMLRLQLVKQLCCIEGDTSHGHRMDDGRGSEWGFLPRRQHDDLATYGNSASASLG